MYIRVHVFVYAFCSLICWFYQYGE